MAVEGVSGSGKSTLARLLANRLAARTLHVMPPPLKFLAGYINQHGTPLTQFAFYLAGVLDAADTIREHLAVGNIVTDRYVNSFIANHTAVNNLNLEAVTGLAAPFMAHLPRPNLTVYLDVSEAELRRRMEIKPDFSKSDRLLLEREGLLDQVQGLYRQLAAHDPTAVHVKTDGRTPEELAEEVHNLLETAHAQPR